MFFKPTEVQNIQRGKRDENWTTPDSRKGVRDKQESLSDLLRNHCPESTRTSVRFTQESLSGINRNQCLESARISVRFTQESLSGLGKNMHYASNIMHYRN